MDERDEHEIFLNSLPSKTYVGSPFQGFEGQRMRIANKYVDGKGGFEYATIKGETVLRETSGGRFQIKATFIEDDRSFKTVTIQRFSENGAQRPHFTFLPDEIAKLLKFLTDVKRLHFPSAGSVNATDNDLEDLLLNPDQARKVMSANPTLLASLARTEVTDEDIIALGYRKQQLRIFKSLLDDTEYFASEASRHPKGGEQVWQNFFEANPWIFGYGLSMIHFGPLDSRKLEQMVRGSSVWGKGKRVDALLKSAARISTACFVEIKRHDTELLTSDAYRGDIWQPSKELTGAIAQVQGTVAAALDNLGLQQPIEDQNGNPTGEVLFSIEPRSFVIAGRLDEFDTINGINARKFRSFELFRRNLVRPEVVTFDELYERTALIVASAQQHG
ncbi:Shedu immune nuclease family protein [Rhizobium leguminosarum]